MSGPSGEGSGSFAQSNWQPPQAVEQSELLMVLRSHGRLASTTPTQQKRHERNQSRVDIQRSRRRVNDDESGSHADDLEVRPSPSYCSELLLAKADAIFSSPECR